MRLIEGSCEETSECLSLHLEGELRGWRRLRVARHLARCERCQAVLESLGRAVRHLRSLARTELAASPSVADAVLVRIREDGR